MKKNQMKFYMTCFIAYLGIPLNFVQATVAEIEQPIIMEEEGNNAEKINSINKEKNTQLQKVSVKEEVIGGTENSTPLPEMADTDYLNKVVNQDVMAVVPVSQIVKTEKPFEEAREEIQFSIEKLKKSTEIKLQEGSSLMDVMHNVAGTVEKVGSTIQEESTKIETYVQNMQNEAIINNDATIKTTESLKEEIKQLQEKMESTKTSITHYEEKNNELEQELKTKTEQLDTMTKQHTDLTEKLKKSDDQEAKDLIQKQQEETLQLNQKMQKEQKDLQDEKIETQKIVDNQKEELEKLKITIDQLKESLATSEKEKELIQSELQTTKNTYAQLEVEKKTQESKLNTTIDENKRLVTDVDDQTIKRKNLEKANKALTDKLKKANQEKRLLSSGLTASEVSVDIAKRRIEDLDAQALKLNNGAKDLQGILPKINKKNLQAYLPKLNLCINNMLGKQDSLNEKNEKALAIAKSISKETLATSADDTVVFDDEKVKGKEKDVVLQRSNTVPVKKAGEKQIVEPNKTVTDKTAAIVESPKEEVKPADGNIQSKEAAEVVATEAQMQAQPGAAIQTLPPDGKELVEQTQAFASEAPKDGSLTAQVAKVDQENPEKFQTVNPGKGQVEVPSNVTVSQNVGESQKEEAATDVAAVTDTDADTFEKVVLPTKEKDDQDIKRSKDIDETHLTAIINTDGRRMRRANTGVTNTTNDATAIKAAPEVQPAAVQDTKTVEVAPAPESAIVNETEKTNETVVAAEDAPEAKATEPTKEEVKVKTVTAAEAAPEVQVDSSPVTEPQQVEPVVNETKKSEEQAPAPESAIVNETEKTNETVVAAGTATPEVQSAEQVVQVEHPQEEVKVKTVTAAEAAPEVQVDSSPVTEPQQVEPVVNETKKSEEQADTAEAQTKEAVKTNETVVAAGTATPEVQSAEQVVQVKHPQEKVKEAAATDGATANGKHNPINVEVSEVQAPQDDAEPAADTFEKIVLLPKESKDDQDIKRKDIDEPSPEVDGTGINDATQVAELTATEAQEANKPPMNHAKTVTLTKPKKGGGSKVKQQRGLFKSTTKL